MVFDLFDSLTVILSVTVISICLKSCLLVCSFLPVGCNFKQVMFFDESFFTYVRVSLHSLHSSEEPCSLNTCIKI